MTACFSRQNVFDRRAEGRLVALLELRGGGGGGGGGVGWGAVSGKSTTLQPSADCSSRSAAEVTRANAPSRARSSALGAPERCAAQSRMSGSLLLRVRQLTPEENLLCARPRCIMTAHTCAA